MGCRLNAYTSREQTVYYANVLKEDTGKAVDILAEMLLNSTFDPAAIEREKSTILQEMEVVEKVEEEVVFDNRESPPPSSSYIHKYLSMCAWMLPATSNLKLTLRAQCTTLRTRLRLLDAPSWAQRRTSRT